MRPACPMDFIMRLLDPHSMVYMSVTPARQNDSTCANPIGALSFIDASGRQKTVWLRKQFRRNSHFFLALMGLK